MLRETREQTGKRQGPPNRAEPAACSLHEAHAGGQRVPPPARRLCAAAHGKARRSRSLPQRSALAPGTSVGLWRPKANPWPARPAPQRRARARAPHLSGGAQGVGRGGAGRGRGAGLWMVGLIFGAGRATHMRVEAAGGTFSWACETAAGRAARDVGMGQRVPPRPPSAGPRRQVGLREAMRLGAGWRPGRSPPFAPGAGLRASA
ncbi:MAG: hypothetical protein J3K34DRAFT_413866 [Monoraphidium minutum]|nr:MAG: hypothetical protein J3K34DRAFT_413866 [Monoraphidium minutum]